MLLPAVSHYHAKCALVTLCRVAVGRPLLLCSVFATTTPTLRESSEAGAPGVGGLYMSDCAPAPFNPAIRWVYV